MNDLGPIIKIAKERPVVEPTISDSNSVSANVIGTYSSRQESAQVDMSQGIERFKFESNLQYWNNETFFISANNFDNIHFKAIVDMGEAAVPYIIDELKKGPTPLVNALDQIYPGRVVYKGFVPLKKVCDIWLQILVPKNN